MIINTVRYFLLIFYCWMVKLVVMCAQPSVRPRAIAQHTHVPNLPSIHQHIFYSGIPFHQSPKDCVCLYLRNKMQKTKTEKKKSNNSQKPPADDVIFIAFRMYSTNYGNKTDDAIGYILVDFALFSSHKRWYALACGIIKRPTTNQTIAHKQ